MATGAKFFLLLGFFLGTTGACFAYFRFSSPILAFYLVLGGIGCGVICLLFSLLSLFTINKTYIGILVGVLCATAFAYMAFQANKHPINDISTNLEKIPVFQSKVIIENVKDGQEFIINPKLLKRDYNESFKAIQKVQYPEIFPYKTSLSSEQAYDFVLKIIKEQYPQWKVVLNDEELKQIEAEKESYFFHFIDDILITVKSIDETSSEINMRSRSRDGKSDIGENTKRILQFFSKLHEIEVSYKKTLPAKQPIITKPTDTSLVVPNANK